MMLALGKGKNVYGVGGEIFFFSPMMLYQAGNRGWLQFYLFHEKLCGKLESSKFLNF